MGAQQQRQRRRRPSARRVRTARPPPHGAPHSPPPAASPLADRLCVLTCTRGAVRQANIHATRPSRSHHPPHSRPAARLFRGRLSGLPCLPPLAPLRLLLLLRAHLGQHRMHRLQAHPAEQHGAPRGPPTKAIGVGGDILEGLFNCAGKAAEAFAHCIGMGGGRGGVGCRGGVKGAQGGVSGSAGW